MAFARFMIPVLATLALAGCCASPTGCYVPVPGVPTAWDGDGPRPDDEVVPRKKSAKRARLATEISGSHRGAGAEEVADARAEVVPPADGLTAEDAAARDADARLRRKLMICRGCLPPGADDAIGRVAGR